MIGDTRKPITCAVPQGLVIGPILWNIMYDDLLELSVPLDVELVVFSDDMAIVGTAQNKELVEFLVNHVLSAVAGWMSTHEHRVALTSRTL